MNDFQTILINRLAHQVKNELTTLRLALFNLDHLIDAVSVPDGFEQQSEEFISVMKSTLSQSIQTISHILLITRSDREHFKDIHAMQILYDAIIQHKKNHLFAVNIPLTQTAIHSDAKLLQLFFKFLLDFIIEHKTKEKPQIKVQGFNGQEQNIVFSGPFLFDPVPLFLQNNNELINKNVKSIQELMLRQLADYLQISIHFKQKEDAQASEMILLFNQ